jgi:hypothetical protein
VSGSAAQLTAWNLLRAAPAQLVDHAADDFLARAGRPQDEHRDVGLGGRPDPLEDDEHLLVAADHLAEALDGRGAVFVADGGAALEEGVEQLARGRVVGRAEGVAGCPAPGARTGRRGRS